jgi:hypothetical protein
VKVTRHPGPESRLLTDAVFDVCPHCGALVESVTVCGVARIRCDVERPAEFADGTFHFIRMIHLCDEPRARRGAIRDIVRQIPR